MFESKLRQEIDQRFNGEDLRLVCADLGLDYDDDLIGRTKDARILSLIQYIQKRGLMEQLLSALKKHRPTVDWQALVTYEESQSQVVYWRDQLRLLILHNRPVQVGLALVVVVALIGIIALLNSGQETPPDNTPLPVANANENPTLTPLSSPSSEPEAETEPDTPTPQVEDTPTPQPAPDVIIIEFEGAQQQNIRLARRIEADLQETLVDYGIDDVNIAVQSEPINSISEAQSLATESGSKVVVWGFLDSIGVNIRIFLNDEKQARRITRTDELPLANAENPQDELAFFASDTIPENISFISLFVIGQLYYQNNQYQDGFDAFDAATANLPEGVIFTNEALLYFFEARQLDYGGSDDLERIACGYAQAIEADPEFVPAYVNLSILLYNNEDINDLECLDADISYWSLMDQALALQPDSALLQYNDVVFDSQFGRFALDEEVEYVQQIIEKDPSISGAYLLLGRLTAVRGEWQLAIDSLETAVNMLPDLVEPHFNLGQLYIINDELDKAENELQMTLSLAPGDPEILLALANLALEQGNPDEASEYLEQIPPDSSPFFQTSPEYIATLLRSRMAYDDGNIEEAIAIIETLTDPDDPDFPLTFSNIFVYYLIGSLYQLNGQAALANNVFQNGVGSGITPWPETMMRAENYTADLAWNALDITCDLYNLNDLGRFENYDVDDCPNGTLVSGAVMTQEEHISCIYDTLQMFIPYRFKNIPNIPLGQACPFVFTYDSLRNRWQLDNTIIYQLVGPESEQPQKRPLTNFDGRLIIQELEPEVSYLDQIYIIVEDSEGREYILTANNDLLRQADDQYLVMRTGDSLSLSFPDFHLIGDVAQVWIVAEGYYIPLTFSP